MAGKWDVFLMNHVTITGRRANLQRWEETELLDGWNGKRNAHEAINRQIWERSPPNDA